ncbi:MAG: FHA domain-containing protein [Anaerolineae bacterium]|nr:FHA domain-containing protein [Anaerolineae bacterium]
MANKFPYEDGEGEVKLRCRLNGPEIADQEVIIGRQGFRVGRSRENNMTLNHREISRQHMRIAWQDDNRYYVEDLNSSNGTYLNEEKLKGRDPIPLQEGDYVRFGPFLLTIIEIFEEKRERPRLGLLGASLEPTSNGHVTYPPGIPRDKSTWLKYLPSIYEDDEFLGRYLLIFESIMSPITWVIDNFDEYLGPEMAPVEWVQWLAGWFDVLLVPEVPEARQREVLKQIGWLFLRRGTPTGLERLLELYFGVNVTILEPSDQPCHFIVQIPLSQSEVKVDRETVEFLIRSQTPAFASFDVQIS